MGRLASAIIILLGLIVGVRVAVPYFQQQTRMTTNRGTPQVTPQVTPQPRSAGFSSVPGNPSSPTPSPSPTTQIYNPPTALPATPYPPNSSGPPQGIRGGW
ncbi:MAG: hypothetical protein ACKO24_01610 [Leptolyngbyaceae cyanobacterium]